MVAQNEPPELSVRLNSLRAETVDLGVPVHGDPGPARGDRHRRAVRRVGERRAAPRGSSGRSRGRRCCRPDCSRPSRGCGCSTCAPRRAGRPASWRRSWPIGASWCASSATPAAPGPCTRRSTGSARRAPGSSSPMRSSSRTARFDRILIDPPCSGLGVLAGAARRPLARGRGVGRPDGRRLSGGCSAHARDAARARRPPRLLGVHDPARARARACSPGGRQTLPHRDGTDGFYMARSTRGASARRPGGRRRPIHYSGGDAGMAHHRRGCAVDPLCRFRPGPRAGGARCSTAGARVIHIDVMDGHFVPVITFGPKMVADIADVIHDHDGFADVHLMIEQPERHIAQFAEAGADSITVHVETCPHLHYTLQQINELGCRAGLTLNPATPVEAISEAAQYADVLLCMSVNPGWGGQSFIPATLDRLPRIARPRGARASRSRWTAASPGTRRRASTGPARTSSWRARRCSTPTSPADAYTELVDVGRRRGRRRVALTDADRAHLARCLELAERGRRTAAPNPVVGAVVVRDGRVIGEGWHERPGRPSCRDRRAPRRRRRRRRHRLHEPGAVQPPRAHAPVRRCAHRRGREPGRRGDDRPHRQGRRRRRRPPARRRSRRRHRRRRCGAPRPGARTRGGSPSRSCGRPHVTYKAAVSADGRTAAAGDGPRWISSEESRALVHEMRAPGGRCDGRERHRDRRRPAPDRA